VISVSLIVRDAIVANATGSRIAGVVVGVDVLVLFFADVVFVLFFADVVFVLFFADVVLNFNTDVVAYDFTVEEVSIIKLLVVVSIGVAEVPIKSELFVVVSIGVAEVPIKSELFVVVITSTGVTVVTIVLLAVEVESTGVIIVDGVARTTHCINPQLEPPLKHFPAGGGVHASHLPLAAV
jgi:hypothetical protein